jgi:hypothetical protein
METDFDVRLLATLDVVLLVKQLQLSSVTDDGSFCEGLSDTRLLTGFAAGTAWRVLDKPQGRKPRAFRRCGAAGLIYGDLTIVCDRFGGLTWVW